MTSLGQYCTRNFLNPKNSFDTFSVSRSSSSKQCSNMVINHHSIRPIFCQLSPGRKERLIGVFPKHRDQWRLRFGDDGSCGIAPFSQPIPSSLDLVQSFYDAINSKDPKTLEEKLDQILSQDCVYQDLFFYIPFEGKQSIKKFMCDIVDAMGHQMHVVVDSMKQGDDYTAIVVWHLGWKDKDVPFTTGCRFFECEEVEGKLLIRKITGMEELPVKPGELLLKLLKAVSNFCESYPNVAEGLLQLKAQGIPGGGLDSLLDMLGLKQRQ